MSGSDSNHTDEAMSDKGKESDGSKGAAEEQSGPARAMSGSDSDHTDKTPRRIKTTKMTRKVTEELKEEVTEEVTEEKTIDNPSKPEIKDEKVEGITKKFDSLSTKDREETNGTPREKTPRKKLKFDKFVSEPLQNKIILDVPGIDMEHGKKLMENGYRSAEDLVKKFLSEDINMDKKKFIEFLAQEGIFHNRWQDEIYKACKTWTDNHREEAEELKTEAEELKTKFYKFVNELLEDKDISEVPGIKEEHAKELRENRYRLAEDLVGKFLDIDMDKVKFIEFLTQKGSVDKRWRDEIYNACKTWTDNHPKEAEELKTEAEEFYKFVNELLEGKDISEVPGIKEEHKEKLSKNGYRSARDLVKKFLSEDIKMDKDKFIEFFTQKGFVDKRWRDEIYNACKTWTDNHPKEAEELKTEAEEIKFNKFVEKPLEGKDISEVPGIKEEHKIKLSENGCRSAKDLVGEFLSGDIDMDKDKFIKFLARVGSVDERCGDEIYNACKTWTDNHPDDADLLRTC